MSGAVRIESGELDRILAKLDLNSAHIVNRIAFEVEGDAKQRAPVDTGALRASGATDPATPQDKTAIVSFDVEYAIYQEYGTHKMAAQPYFNPAIEAVTARYNSGEAFTELVK